MQKQPSEVFLEISQNSQENTCSCEFCEISENTFFIEHLWTAAFGNAKKKFNTDSFLKTKFFEKSRIYFKMARTKPRVVLQTFESTGLLQWTILKTKIAVIFTAQKMKFSIKYFFSKFLQETADLVTLNQEIHNGTLRFYNDYTEA